MEISLFGLIGITIGIHLAPPEGTTIRIPGLVPVHFLGAEVDEDQDHAQAQEASLIAKNIIY